MKNKISLLLCLLLPMGLAAKPVRVPSFGANGTHWPELIPTPFMYDNTISNIVEVPCNWTAIKNAIQAVTINQANSGTLILIQPGDLVGLGNSSGATAVLSNIGSASWGQRVTLAPRDGYGTVKFKNGVKFLNVFGVCFAGFETVGDTGIKLEGCRRSALAWTRVNGHLGMYGNDGFVTDTLEIVEVVQPNHHLDTSDSAQGFSGGGGISGWRFDGCYHAPRFYVYPYSGPRPHMDTFQFAGAGGGDYGSITMRDSAYFGSPNAAIQTGNINGLTLEKCYVVSGPVSLSRYPFLPGGTTEATSNAFNGSGRNLQAKDCVFIGGMTVNTADVPRPWSFVQNTRVSKTYGSHNIPLSGSWTVDTGLNESNSGMPPYPTDAYLAGIWANPGATTQVTRPVFIPPGGAYGAPQTVSMTCSTAGATIYYTVDGTVPTTSSTRYTVPISVPASVTLKAIAVAGTLTNSSVTSDDYSISNLVEIPVFSPGGGFYSSAQNVTISTGTSGATIYYTVDGTIPTALSKIYTTAVPISGTTTLKAIGIKSGSASSPIVSASYGVGSAYPSREAWTTVHIPSLAGRFTIGWDAIPDSNPMDGVMGLSLGPARSYADLACIVRFSPAGVIDVRNGGTYGALAALRYVVGTSYRFSLDVDIDTRKYSVSVTPDGGVPITLAQNYAFRTEQATVASLDNLGLVSLGAGTHTVSNVVVGSKPPVTPPSAPQGLRVVTPDL